MSQFSKGLLVKYLDFVGTVRFICNEYVSICISVGEDKSRDVCVLAFRSEWENIHLVEELEK